MDDLAKICYGTNFLSRVIFRVDYSPVLKINESLEASIQESVREELVQLKQNMVVHYKTVITPGGKTDQQQAVTIWEFTDKPTTKKLLISRDFFSIEILKYDTYDKLKALIEKAFSTFVKSYSPLNCTRIGLRYINDIKMEEGNPLEWEEFLYVPLGHLKEDYFKDKNDLSRIMGQTVLTKEDHKLTFNYGIFNGEFPARISRKVFILDFDCYTESIAENEVVGCADRFHKEIQELFESSIKDPLRKIMGKVE